MDDLEGIEVTKMKGNSSEFGNTNVVEPQIAEPTIGMLFDSADEMFEFYKAYGRQQGFPVMRRTCKKGKDGVLKYVTFTCARHGKARSKSAKPLRPQPNSKIGCKARIGGHQSEEDGKWVVVYVILEHNHGLSPDKSRAFRCNRSVGAHMKAKLETNDQAATAVAKSFNSMVVEASGYGNVSFMERDVRTHVDKERRLGLEKEDGELFRNYFLNLQLENIGFVFNMNVDAEGRLKNVFWANQRSTEAFKDFGDVVTFEVISPTNTYGMSLASFMGVNHHGDSISLGCGLISQEDTETIAWLFQTWLTYISGSPPIGIISDQNKAVKKAIEIVFPNARHRWCLSHILKKVPEKLGPYKQYDEIKFLLHNAVCDSQSWAEFEESWRAMVVEYNLGDNWWLSNLYNERHRWVPCFLNNSF